MAEDKEVVTTKSDYTNTSMANVMDYMIKTIMKESINTAIPVVVTSVTRNGDGSGAGTLSAKPLIMQRDGENNSIPNGEIPSLPYFRYQFGENAVICDPEVGDVGLAIFAQSDCSNLNVLALFCRLRNQGTEKLGYSSPVTACRSWSHSNHCPTLPLLSSGQ